MEHLIVKGNPAWAPALFVGVAFANLMAIAYGHLPISHDVDVTKALGWSFAEELMFRLFPLAIVRGFFGNSPLATVVGGVVSSAAFAGEHYVDTHGNFHPEFIGTHEVQNLAMGATLYGVARYKGVLNSYAVHAGVNSSILAATMMGY